MGKPTGKEKREGRDEPERETLFAGGKGNGSSLGEMKERASEKRWMLFQDTAGTTPTRTWYSRLLLNGRVFLEVDYSIMSLCCDWLDCVG